MPDPESVDVASDRDPLTRLLVDFARILGTEYSLQKILDQLVVRIVEMLPVTGAGIMLMGGGGSEDMHFVAASDEAVLTLEVLQNELVEGPCHDAYRSGEPVAVIDLSQDKMFPQFSPRASQAGLKAVFTFPLRLDDHRLGALDLYRDTPGPLSAGDLDLAQVLADVAAGYLANARSRTELAETAKRLQYESIHDPLTGLANRALLTEMIDRATARARRSHQIAAVLFIDLDGFKAVNDRYGHHLGDDLLIAVARRLSHLLRPGDTLARLGGDEFVALCEDMTAAGDAEIIGRRITAALAEPFQFSGVRLTVGGSVGIAFSGFGQDIPAIILRDADFAMYEAKRDGGGQYRVSDRQARVAADRRTNLEWDLHQAEHLDQLDLHYQPIINIDTGKLVAVEALVRWHHPTEGLIMPDLIIPAAERSGLIESIGLWVLRRACQDLGRWRIEHPGLIPRVSVNVSARQMMSESFVSTVAAVLSQMEIAPADLTLEVTESLFIKEPDRAARVMRNLKNLGVRLALDDFGTGYSSLSYLRQYPVNTLKIDRSFTTNLISDKVTRSIVQAVVDLSHTLELDVVAEGVETSAELDLITALGADLAQGYLIGRPMDRYQLLEHCLHR